MRLELIGVLLGAIAPSISPGPQVLVFGVRVTEQRLDHISDVRVMLDEMFGQRRREKEEQACPRHDMGHVQTVDELSLADLAVLVGVGVGELIVSMRIGQPCIAIVVVHVAGLNGVVPQKLVLGYDIIACAGAVVNREL